MIEEIIDNTYFDDYDDGEYEIIECWSCNGTGEGMTDYTNCPVCHGRGYVEYEGE